MAEANLAARAASLPAGIVRLLRPPNVFTAAADSLAGLALVRSGALSASDPGLSLVLASASLYLGGMALNDYFDREVDAVERPERPIPSGAVPPLVAAAVGVGLLIAGLGAASLAGARAERVAALLALAILLYDSTLKGTGTGFVNMGLCRGLNFAMPLALVEGSRPPFALVGPIFLAAYVAILTYLSRDEVGGTPAIRARRAAAAMAILAVALAITLAAAGSAPFGWLCLAAVVARGAQLFAPVRADPSGPVIGRAIGGGILLIPVFDAVFVAAAGHLFSALVVAALAAPAVLLRRHYSPT